MGRCIFIIAFQLLSVFSRSQSISRNDLIAPAEHSFCKIIDAEKHNYLQKKFTEDNRDGEASSGYDITYLRCNWSVDPSENYIAGDITTWFIPLTADFDSLIFDLTNQLTVDSIL